MGTEVLRPHDCLIRPIIPNPNPNPREIRKRREGAKKDRLVMGRVTILKRGESLKGKEKAVKGGGAWDPVVFGPDRLGPDPDLMPKQIRMVAGRVEGDGYAGSACAMSPSPRAVPLPSFWRKREEGPGIVVDRSATKDLRRLLRLEN